ncbi:hypothetical protein T484DRAFT_1959043 [Baffinella frigidus]|nr:hypothetical protein T484DRAFT_1959043 [Cryptophyta sp. CCMP2293]
MCKAPDIQVTAKFAATMPTLASRSPHLRPEDTAASPSNAAMGDLDLKASCSSSEGAAAHVAPDLADLSAGEKRHRHSSENVDDWEPGMGMDDDADLRPQERRARLAATSLLYERLVQQTAIIRAHVLKRHRKDQVERDISRRVAARHPLWPGAPLRAKPIKSPALSLPGGPLQSCGLSLRA